MFLFLLTKILNSVNLYQQLIINTVKHWDEKNTIPVVTCIVQQNQGTSFIGEYLERRNFSGVMEEKEDKKQKNDRTCSGFSGCMNGFEHTEQEGHMEQNVWEALHMFHKLNIGSILPHLNQGEFVLMNGIYHVQKKKGSSDGVKMSELAEYAHALPPAVSRSIKALEEKGYVRRLVSQKDRRNTTVQITESGQEILQESNDIVNEFIRRVFEKTDKEEMARLVRYVQHQYKLAKEELEKIRESQKKAKKATEENA